MVVNMKKIGYKEQEGRISLKRSDQNGLHRGVLMKSKRKAGAFVSAAVGLLIASSSLFAHHSEAVYDKDRLVTVKGSIIEHKLINPHQLIRIKVKDANGQFAVWTLHSNPASSLREVGWTQDTLKPGDEVTATGWPYRSGLPAMSWLRIVKADGKEVPLTMGRKQFMAEYLAKHGKELPKEEYEIYKKSIEGVVPPSTNSLQLKDEKY